MSPMIQRQEGEDGREAVKNTLTSEHVRPAPHPFYGDSYERGPDPWHADAFPEELKGAALRAGNRKSGWFLIDGCGNEIGFVPDGTPVNAPMAHEIIVTTAKPAKRGKYDAQRDSMPAVFLDNLRTKALAAPTGERSGACPTCGLVPAPGLPIGTGIEEAPPFRIVDDEPVTCTPDEREHLDRLYEETPDLKKAGIDQFDGWYCLVTDVTDACLRAWPEGDPGHSQTPFEYITTLIDERDDARKALASAQAAREKGAGKP